MASIISSKNGKPRCGVGKHLGRDSVGTWPVYQLSRHPYDQSDNGHHYKCNCNCGIQLQQFRSNRAGQPDPSLVVATQPATLGKNYFYKLLVGDGKCIVCKVPVPCGRLVVLLKFVPRGFCCTLFFCRFLFEHRLTTAYSRTGIQVRAKLPTYKELCNIHVLHMQLHNNYYVIG